MMHVKICGLTTLEDARSAVKAGADLLGFNFYPKSSRYITPTACSQLVDALWQAVGGDLQRVRLVGVFVNADPSEILHMLDACRLDMAQLSGDEPPEHLAALSGRGFKAIRTVGQGDLPAALTHYPPRLGAPAALVDAAAPGAYGGTGRLADWQQARALAVQQPILLAGGLSPENVAAAVKAVRPWGVDVASGVESAPGKKDADKVRRFICVAKAEFPILLSGDRNDR